MTSRVCGTNLRMALWGKRNRGRNERVGSWNKRKSEGNNKGGFVGETKGLASGTNEKARGTNGWFVGDTKQRGFVEQTKGQ